MTVLFYHFVWQVLIFCNFKTWAKQEYWMLILGLFLFIIRASLIINCLLGEYKPGYIKIFIIRYFKTQVLTPTYNLAKTLNIIIIPYIPETCMPNSTNQFIDILNSYKGIVGCPKKYFLYFLWHSLLNSDKY